MERMYQEYRDVADFYIVYISEAHASDDKYPVGYAKEMGITEHKTFGQRCNVAARLQKDKELTIPCLIDGMDNAAADAYKGWPDRVFVVRKDGKLAVAAKRGPWGFKPGMNKTKSWLASYKETGIEPDISLADNDEPDIGSLQMELFAAMRGKDYQKALNISETLYNVDPHDAGTLYNTACIHCLLGHKEQAYTWLEKAIRDGYKDADHLLADEDFETIRVEQRFQNIVERLRGKDGLGT